ncbi:MAG: SDR family oxidoreductase [Oscillospiraceae bacterium]|jgi:NAD(P)-dependent dehydrogenase (short-subunit alcohol dehydrogenase family)|nr:SDR family oxidoreductase [Oscillospiraceae bacterium]
MVRQPITSLSGAFSLRGKNAIVTGGNKGLGLGIAQAFAQQGANVALFARDVKSGDEAVKGLTAINPDGKFKFYKADVSSFDDARAAVKSVVADYGDVDILVNNAGVPSIGNILDMDENLSEWYRCINLDLNGAVHMTYLVGKLMRDRGVGGKIINITSNAGEHASKTTNMTTYCSAKAGLNMFTQGIALELAPFGINVNAIAPGFTESNIGTDPSHPVSEEDKKKGQEMMAKVIPAGRMGKAIEIGALAAYLASEASNQMTGAILTIDGGHSLGI